MSTLKQAEVSEVLSALKLEKAASDDKPGGPEAWAVSDQTIEYLRDKTFVVDGDGSISVTDK